MVIFIHHPFINYVLRKICFEASANYHWHGLHIKHRDINQQVHQN